MAVNVKMGVDIGGFTSGIKQGQQILKGLNAELKASEAEFKATGNAEQKMTSQTKTLNSQINVQKGIADQARQALDRMTESGIKPTDAAYQKMYLTMMNAEAGMNEAQAALNGLTGSAQEAAAGAQQLQGSLNGISKKISLDQVRSGIEKITSGLENAAKKAVDLGEKLWNTIMDSAARADDTATMAQMYGIDLDTFMRMQKLVAGGMDTSVEAMLKSQDKLKKGIGNSSKDVISTLRELGVTMSELQDTGGGILEFVPKDADQVFWEAGQALLGMSDAFDKEAAAQALFGKSWKELVPLFESYKTLDEYNDALAEQEVNSEETIRDLAALNDAVGALESSWTTLKDELIGALAPALSGAADSLGGLLDKITEYLKTDKGQAMLSSMAESVSKLFEDLGSIDPESVVENFTTVFNGLVSGLQWIADKKDTVVAALGGIVAGWAALQLTGGALQILQLINGLQTLGVIGGGGGGGATAAGGGLFGTVNTWLSGAGAQLTNLFNSGLQNAAPAIGDWLVHESPLATIFNGTESWSDWWNRQQAEQQERTETFGSNWDPNSADANVIAKNAGNTIRFWDDFWSRALTGDKGWKWGPSGEGTGSDWTDEEAQNLANAIAQRTEEMDAVSVEIEPEVKDGAAADVAAQVGTVQVPVQLIWNGKNWGAGGLGGSFLQKHANGLPWVPYDGYLALLHQGERVLTASQNRNYTYNNNNYFGNVNLNNGQDIDALCDRIDRRNRRMQNGYGS